LTPPGPRARPSPPRRRSPTRSAAAANANAPPAAGHRYPTERDVVRLVSEGLANNDIGTRLFVSPRTVQTHLTHVYTKLGLTSRVQLVQEAARHT
jgi:DNA-binding CsgD family transcriptional regulator